MGRGGRWHHLPQGIQAAVVRAVWWGLVDGHELLLVLAGAQCAVVVVPEPGAFLPPQPDVIQLPEPHAPRQPQPRLPPPIPPWPPQPAPAPGLQQQGVKQTLIRSEPECDVFSRATVINQGGHWSISSLTSTS
ncbi:uncharacterized protein LOC119332131 isoform X3 [Triticum dicoccoides]|uniref:uncharacterized protein LOC119332131 isoform X3 n=1 Tax=Triticum dicoccoides TaxID=85692 RepID=UPI001891833E|nr:uncharacterized protein LOC119332131 isoform X3 [Triticum dicoccoides]